ncbi:MAG TPA: MBL fold metallo-hydrolase [Candidatus Limnocylindrales bacterium]|nr:MBL fold metallo-hydrolase [Candidatus Limnocylindrales bacterium]
MTTTNATTGWNELGDRVFTRRYRFFDQQIGLVLGDGEALVIDTRTSPGQARELIADIRRVTSLPVRLVVDSHWHSDHVFGNHDFRPATIWGHERCRTRLLENGERQRVAVAEGIPDLAADLATLVVDPPDQTFEDAATIEVGGRPVELRFLGRGHTDADIVVAIPDAGVLFAGDLLENDAVPYFGDGYPIEWPATVERLLALVAGPVVPGHGSVGDRGFVEAQLAAFRAVADAARRLHAGELDRAAALAAMPFDGDAASAPLDRALAQLRGELD